MHVVEHAASALEALRDGRVLITGGTGFIGRWMVESLLRANDALDLHAECVVVTRNAPGFAEAAPHIASHKRVRVHQADIRDLGRGVGTCSHVLHLATESGPGLTSARSFQTAVDGTRRALSFAADNGAKKFLVASSGAVYGRQPPELERVTEDFHGAPLSTDPASGYGQGKRAAEFLSVSSTHAMDVTIARGFTFVGPLLPIDSNFAIGNFIRDALERPTIEVAGDGTPRRSYLHSADLAAWLWVILVTGAPGRAYNVGSEAEISIAELASVVGSTLAPGKPVRIAEVASTSQAPARYVPSTARATTELGLRQRIPLREAIRRTADWYLE